MLNCVQGETIKILGIKLSSRPDFLYGEVKFYFFFWFNNLI